MPRIYSYDSTCGYTPEIYTPSPATGTAASTRWLSSPTRTSRFLPHPQTESRFTTSFYFDCRNCPYRNSERLPQQAYFTHRHGTSRAYTCSTPTGSAASPTSLLLAV